MSAPRRRDPFAELIGEFSERLRGDRWQPDVDVFETEQAVVVRAELAGVERGDLRVSVDEQVLSIRGVRHAPEPRDVKRLHQMEIAAGPFERKLVVPGSFDRERVSAHLADGFLTVTLPKRSPRRVPVEREAEPQTEREREKES